MTATLLKTRALGSVPDMLVMESFGLTEDIAAGAADHAVVSAREAAPKLSGRGAMGIKPVYAEGFFGLHWQDDHIWYQESGIRAFTMHALAGKVIPMWINDPTGKERAKNPKAKIRATVDGRVQVLIFRRAAKHGERKTVERTKGGQTFTTTVPRSYPGAPGRINRREAAAPYTTPGKVGGQIAVGNGGVRWRHPGRAGTGFMHDALVKAADVWQIPQAPIFAALYEGG